VGRANLAHVAALAAAVRRLAADSIQRVSPTRWDALYGAVEPTLPSKWRQMLPGDKLHKLAALLVLDSPDAIYQRLSHRGISRFKRSLARANAVRPRFGARPEHLQFDRANDVH
jgi:hypothetical protein